MTAAPAPTRFGAFIAPYHDPAGNPTLQLRRDLDLAVLLDELGYDEVWFGEHHSGAYEMSASPEVMIADRLPCTIDWRMTMARSAPGETMAKAKIAIKEASSIR